METIEKVLERNRLKVAVVTRVRVVLEGKPEDVRTSLQGALHLLRQLEGAVTVKLNEDYIPTEATAILEVLRYVPETNAQVRARLEETVTDEERRLIEGLNDKFRILSGR